MNLFRPRGPFTVFRGVWSVIINSLNGKPRWALSHVCKKALEMFPCFADSDTTPTVVSIILSLWILAAVTHGNPDHVGFGSTQSVSSVKRPYHFPLKTTAAFFVASAKAVCISETGISAIANALPHYAIALPSIGLRNDNHSIESLPDYVRAPLIVPINNHV